MRFINGVSSNITSLVIILSHGVFGDSNGAGDASRYTQALLMLTFSMILSASLDAALRRSLQAPNQPHRDFAVFPSCRSFVEACRTVTPSVMVYAFYLRALLLAGLRRASGAEKRYSRLQ